jgi:glycosyltransferase involved in cell wall biosynthesis
MRILHIVGTMDPAAGGLTEAIRMLVHLSPPDIQNEIATTDAPGVNFLRSLPVPAHGLGNFPAFSAPALLPWLHANRDRFDGAIAHGLWSSVTHATRKAFHGKKPYVVFPHGMLDPYFKRASLAKHLKKIPFYYLNEYWNLRFASRVLFTTPAERDLATQSFAFHHWDPAVLPLGTEPSPSNKAALLAAFHAACPEAQGRRFVLYLGRIHPKKGADMLLDAFAKISPTNPHLHLVMAGPDPDNWGAQIRSNLLPDTAARIHWPGMLRGDAKWGAFAACEAFILPSHQENFGIAVVEALASARPALITHPVNISPKIAATNAGLIAADTPQGIHDLLKQWLALTPTQRETMSTNALHLFQTQYDMRQNAAAILNIFRDIATTDPML